MKTDLVDPGSATNWDDYGHDDGDGASALAILTALAVATLCVGWNKRPWKRPNQRENP